MKDLLRRLVKDGEVEFYQGTRIANRAAADELVAAAAKEGYIAKRRTTCFGYLVIC